MIAHLTGVRLQLHRSRLVVRRFLSIEKRFEWRFCVNDDPLAAREVDDQIRPESSALGEERRLLIEVAL